MLSFIGNNYIEIYIRNVRELYFVYVYLFIHFLINFSACLQNKPFIQIIDKIKIRQKLLIYVILHFSELVESIN